MSQQVNLINTQWHSATDRSVVPQQHGDVFKAKELHMYIVTTYVIPYEVFSVIMSINIR